MYSFFYKNYCCCRNRVYFINNPANWDNNLIIRPITAVSPICTGSAIYASGTSSSVANLSIIPLQLGAKTAATTLSVSNNQVNVPQGIYQISFGATGTTTNSSSSTFAVQLYANGLPLTGNIVSSNASSTLPASTSKTIIYNAISPTELALYNVSGNILNIASAFLTVQKLSWKIKRKTNYFVFLFTYIFIEFLFWQLRSFI